VGTYWDSEFHSWRLVVKGQGVFMVCHDDLLSWEIDRLHLDPHWGLPNWRIRVGRDDDSESPPSSSSSSNPQLSLHGGQKCVPVLEDQTLGEGSAPVGRSESHCWGISASCWCASRCASHYRSVGCHPR